MINIVVNLRELSHYFYDCYVYNFWIVFLLLKIQFNKIFNVLLNLCAMTIMQTNRANR